MKKYEQIVQFIVNIILGNIFKFILAFAILSILLYFTLFLGPLLGSAIGIFFILIFGEGSYLALIMWIRLTKEENLIHTIITKHLKHIENKQRTIPKYIKQKILSIKTK